MILLIFTWLHTHILCLSLFLGLPIGFAYRRLIWSAVLCSSFFPFSFGLQTWQAQVPGGCPSAKSTVWVGSSIQRTYSTFIWNISFNRELARIPPAPNDNQLPSTKRKSIRKTLGQFCVQWNRIGVGVLSKAMWLVWIACQMSYNSTCAVITSLAAGSLL